ncbi:MAG: bile acid:sodium symporter family protein [Kordiimonas sp.]
MDEMIKQVASTYVFPAVIAFVMFGLGLSLKKQDLVAVAKKPTPFIVGLGGQLIFLPLVAFAAAIVLPVPMAIILGLILISLCPGGSTSNAIIFSIGGNVALSVALTIASSLITLFSIPLLLAFAVDYFSVEAGAIAVPAAKIFKSLLLMTAIPVALGMIVGVKMPQFAEKAIPPLKKLSLILILMIIALSVYNAREFITEEIGTIILSAGSLSLAVVLGGYFLSRLFVADLGNRLTIAVEIGVQNTPIAIFLGSSVLNMPELSIVAIAYGVFNYGLIAVLIKASGRNNSGAAVQQA